MTSERRAEAKNMDLDGENDSTDPLVEDLEVAMDELELLQDKLEEYQQHFLFADYSAHMRSLDKNWVWGEKDAETEANLHQTPVQSESGQAAAVLEGTSAASCPPETQLDDAAEETQIASPPRNQETQATEQASEVNAAEETKTASPPQKMSDADADADPEASELERMHHRSASIAELDARMPKNGQVDVIMEAAMTAVAAGSVHAALSDSQVEEQLANADIAGDVDGWRSSLPSEKSKAEIERIVHSVVDHKHFKAFMAAKVAAKEFETGYSFGSKDATRDLDEWFDYLSAHPDNVVTPDCVDKDNDDNSANNTATATGDFATSGRTEEIEIDLDQWYKIELESAGQSRKLKFCEKAALDTWFEMAVDAAFGALAWKYGIELQDEFLLPDDSAPVQKELERLQQKAQVPQVVPSKQKWPTLHQQIAAERGLSYPVEVSERLAESPWVGTMPQRAREVLAFAEHDSLKRPEKELRFADIYHSANRYAVSSGRELLRIQAVEPDDEEHLDKFTEQQLTDLAGNEATESEWGEQDDIDKMMADLASFGAKCATKQGDQ
ncbi:unnamed protein product [Durusdinium trenchii]|uniref:Uncharacterized protein n=1 Tax=Durusdinium trenchii TaxID=1381693 RepID=A0ABP0N4G4_9DINO